MSDETATPEAPPVPETAPAGTPPDDVPPAPDAPTMPLPDVNQPPKTDEQRLAERLEGGATSPVMPWGAGPRPDGWVDPQVEDDAATPAPAVHHRRFNDDGHAVEVDGKWYALVDDQPEKLSALEAQGLSAREACEKLGIAIEPAAE